MATRHCRICGDELSELWYNVFDRREVFYRCRCEAINHLRRAPSGQKPLRINEWTLPPEDAVSVSDVPLRETIGGYHIERDPSIKLEASFA